MNTNNQKRLQQMLAEKPNAVNQYMLSVPRELLQELLDELNVAKTTNDQLLATLGSAALAEDDKDKEIDLLNIALDTEKKRSNHQAILLGDTYTDDKGRVWGRPLARVYAQVSLSLKDALKMLTEARECIYALAQQQAMTDNFYEETLTKIDNLISKESN